MPEVEVLGVYPVEAREPCHLIEVRIVGCDGRFDLSGFTQEDEQPQTNWQVPYAEKLIDPSGDWVEWDLWDGPGADVLWRGDLRVCFFFHYLDLSRQLLTPFGAVELPAPTPFPDRLAEVKYEVP